MQPTDRMRPQLIDVHPAPLPPRRAWLLLRQWARSTCPAGAVGLCAAQFNALAHSNDPTVVVSQILNSSTPVGRAAAAVSSFGKAPCGLDCFMQ